MDVLAAFAIIGIAWLAGVSVADRSEGRAVGTFLVTAVIGTAVYLLARAVL
jgi:hypothetical protein